MGCPSGQPTRGQHGARDEQERVLGGVLRQLLQRDGEDGQCGVGDNVCDHVVPSYVLRYDNGDVKMWDLRNMSLYWDTNVGNGVCGLEYDRRDIKVGMVVNWSLCDS